MSDNMGIGCINAIHKAGLRVPEDMAVIVKVELDTYWAMRGGVDQVQYLQKLANAANYRLWRHRQWKCSAVRRINYKRGRPALARGLLFFACYHTRI
ncbi:hypothetical protein J34TS1_38160 [Paenibacillus azoreducens]|uniref:Uncharacterized protein n=2 Tax=Paenibacillus azoreducens TaxID=116718 RepID=A0A919YE81_9BACL|nr:hypothetical protein J34TS1_38160 [Paenibacillus azoreducens]